MSIVSTWIKCLSCPRVSICGFQRREMRLFELRNSNRLAQLVKGYGMPSLTTKKFLSITYQQVEPWDGDHDLLRTLCNGDFHRPLDRTFLGPRFWLAFLIPPRMALRIHHTGNTHGHLAHKWRTYPHHTPLWPERTPEIPGKARGMRFLINSWSVNLLDRHINLHGAQISGNEVCGPLFCIINFNLLEPQVSSTLSWASVSSLIWSGAYMPEAIVCTRSDRQISGVDQ